MKKTRHLENHFLTDFLVYEFSAIETLRDGKDPTEQENQELWEMLIENGRLYLGKILVAKRVH